MKLRWWMISSGVIGASMLALGIGILIDSDDNGPLIWQIVLLTLMATGTALIVRGLVLVRNEAGAARLVAAGVLPGVLGFALYWFPPAVAVGVLSLVTSWAALQAKAKVEPQT